MMLPWDYKKCPVCGAELSIQYYCIDLIECERFEHCLRCDYDYQSAYGEEQWIIGSWLIHQHYSDSVNKVVRTRKKIERALFWARRNFRKRHGKYRKGGIR